jgi:Rps23 Pro-64 3,4-dihydroxylase Tpa1-like proline 4-hydroxylase
MIALSLLFQGGHTESVEMDEGDPLLPELVAMMGPASQPQGGSSAKVYSITCKKRDQSVVFGASSLVALVASPPLEFTPRYSLEVKQADAPVIVIDDFFPLEQNERMLSFIASSRNNFSSARTAEQQVEFRKGLVLEDTHGIKEQMMLQILPMLPAICSQFHLTYSAVEAFECQITSYRDGDFFRPHVDLINLSDGLSRPFESYQRLISYSYYIHVIPKAFSGGVLKIITPADETRQSNETAAISISPDNNRVVFFPSDILHEITPVTMVATEIDASRLSVNGWIRCRL